MTSMDAKGELKLLAVLRTDIVDSTPFQIEVGDDVAIDAFSQHLRSLEAVVVAHGGTMASSQGDGIFAVFPTVSTALRAAQEMQAMNERRARWHALRPFAVRIGVSSGELLQVGAEFNGLPMAEADRLQGVAEPGQIVCTAGTAALTGGRLDDDIQPIGARELKGFSEPVDLVEVTWSSVGNPMAGLAPALQRRPTTTFVGRDFQLQQLSDLWEQAVRGQPRIVIVEGEAGVGKSRLARELAVKANAAEAVAVYAPCHRDDDRPYGVLGRALQDYVSRLRGQSHLLGSFAANLGPLLPELGNLFPDLVLPLGQDDDASNERFNVRRGISGWLTAAATDEPLLVLLEDLHWIDERSLSVLEYLCDHLVGERLLIVATMRPLGLEGARVSPAVRHLQRNDLVATMALGGLDHPATLGLIEDMAGHSLNAPPETAFAEQVWRHTDGNPFFVQALLGHFAARGDLRLIDGRWVGSDDTAQLISPPEVREAVLSQLVGLSDEGRQLLQVAALLGTTFRLGMLRRLGQQLDLTDLGAIELAVRATMIHEIPGQADSYRFSHEIIRSVFESEVAPDRRASVHELAAEALIELAGGVGGVDDGAVSYHLSFSFDPEVRARAATHAVAGGAKASRTGAFEQASVLYQRAVELLDDPTTPNDPRVRADALLGAGLASHKAGDPGADELLRSAYSAAEDLSDGELLAKAALVKNRGMYTVLGAVDHELVDAFERSLALLDAGPSALRSVVLASLGAELTYSDRERQTAILDEAEAMARSLDDDANLCKVLTIKGQSIWRPGSLAERLEISNTLEQMTGSMVSPGWRFGAASLGFQASMEDGLFARADLLLGRMEHLSGRIREPMVAWFTNLRRCVRATTLGQLDEARTAAERALALGQESWLEDEALLYYFGQQWIINYHEGGLSSLKDTFSAAAASQDRPVLKPALAAILAECGEFDESAAVLAKVDEASFELDDQDLLVTAAVTAIAAAACDEKRCAQLAYDTMVPFEHQMIDNASTHFGSTQHYLGLTAGVLGEADDALIRLQSAVDRHRGAGIDPLTARSQVELARLRMRCGNGEQARTALDGLDRLEEDCRSRGFGGAVAAIERVRSTAPGS